MSRPDAPPIDMIVVVGTAYSGSTMLAMLLDQHPDIVSLGEVTGPGHLAPPIDDYPVWLRGTD